MADRKELLLIEIREDGARVVKRRISDIGEAGDATTDQMGKLKTVLAGLVSAKVLRDTIMLADAYANMLNRLRIVTEGNYELHAAMAAVYKMSRETRTSLEANIDMYARIAINTSQMGLRMKDVVRFATQLNHAIILSGVTAREAQWGMVQFSQALASNTLRGDELRAILEQLPVVTNVIAAHFKVTRGELRELGFQGRITSREIIKAFNEAEAELAEKFGRRLPTIDQGITVLRSSIMQFVGNMDQAVLGTSSMADGLLVLADNIELVGRVSMIAGTVLGTVFLKNLIGIVAQMKLFSVTLLAAHPVAAAILIAGAAVAVFSDKIKIANDSTGTLADLMVALRGNIIDTYHAIGEAIGVITAAGNVNTEYEITISSLLKTSASFIDKFAGLFVGAGQVVKKVFDDMPNYAKRAWNAIISGVESVVDHVIAVFKTLANMLRIFGLNVKMAVTALSSSVEQAMAGNVKQAHFFADQAVLAFDRAAAGGNFGEMFRKNLEKEMSTDVLGGAKAKVEAAGETIGQAFMRGFNMSTLVSSGVDQLLKRAEGAMEDRTMREQNPMFSPTTVQSQLMKDMSNNVGETNNKMIQLRELWIAVNTKQPGTETISLTLDEVNRKMAELQAKSLEVSTGVIDGFHRGFIKIGLEITNFADTAEQTITNAFKGMEDALVSFVQTGKVDFKSLVDSMLADLTRLLARQAIVGLLNSMSGSGGILGSIAGAFGQTASAGTAAAVPATSHSSMGRATGGPVSPGLNYMVGERGRPEMFQPAQPGHITPVDQAQSSGGGSVVIINVASEEEAQAAAAAYIDSSAGDRVIQNKIRTYSSGSKL